MIELKNTSYKIVQIGCGGTGSNLIAFEAQLLSNYNENSLILIDGDHVENKNLRNQKFIKSNIGRYKAEVLCSRYQNVYTNLKISCLASYITSSNNLIDILKDTNGKLNIVPILIGCVDNNHSRKIMNDVFYDEHIKELIYIDVGNGTDDLTGQVVIGYKKNIIKQETSKTTDYFVSASTPAIIQSPVSSIFPNILTDDDDGINRITSCAYHSEEAPQNIATNITAATTVFNIINQIVAFNVIPTHIVYFNAKNPDIVSRDI